MKTGWLVLFLSAAAVGQNSLTPEEAKAGWILLFDGKTMKHWVDPRQKNPPGDAWTIEDGCLKAQSRPRITEDLFSDQTYRDFELEFDWRISPHGNSGVKYRIQDHLWVPRTEGAREKFEPQVERGYVNRIKTRPDHGQDYVIGLEYQVIDDSVFRDPQKNTEQRAGALYDMVTPSSSPAHAVGEFNHSRIVVKGNHVEHWMNGVKVVDTTLDSPGVVEGIEKRWAEAPHILDLLKNQPKKDCPISLQNHGNEAWFRNIKIRKL